MAQIDFINLNQTRESDPSWFIDSIIKPTTIWGNFPGVIQSPLHKKHNYIKSQLRVDVISSIKMISRDRHPVLV